MQRMTQAQFDALAAGARTLSADQHGIKVLLTPDDRIIKLFRRKRLISSALFRPYARRFERASRELASRGIPAVQVERIARVPSMHRDLVVYRLLPGATLREALTGASADMRDRLLERLAAFLATLHTRGVYFRAAHFGNMLVQPSAEGETRLALIDVSESRFRHSALAPRLRARNFRPLTSYAEDLAEIRAFGVERFVQAYVDAAGLSDGARQRFRSALRRVHPSFDAPPVPVLAAHNR
jgi:hypothetical protein